jgi:predicted small lipoprotein YifL
MRKILLLVPLLALAGCTRYEGPLEVRKKNRADAPGYTIEEQQQRARERYSIVEDDRAVGPKVGIDRVGPIGR